jgi:saccharopine dehydrogenase-like NADP-dependent oxidoreductase
VRISIIGCGAEGGTLAGLLAKEEAVEEVVLGDLESARAENLARRVESLGTSTSVRAEKVDGTDRDSVKLLSNGADVVFNATLPLTNKAIMSACLDIGAHYLDLFTYPFEVPGVPRDEAVDGQLDMDQAFKDAGITALPNVGAAPGWTDIAARLVTDRLDVVDRVTVRWADWCDSKELITSFEPSVVFGINMPQPVRWENGTLEEVDLFESREEFEWPPPIGKLPMYGGCLDPEVRTIQFLGKPIGRIEVKSGLAIGRWRSWPEIWIEAIRKQIAANPRSVPPAANLFELLGASFIPSSSYREAYEEGIVTAGAFGVSVEAEGMQGRARTRHRIRMITTLDQALAEVPWSNHMSYATAGAVPRELVLMLGSGEIDARGVIPSVGSLSNYRAILDRLAQRRFEMTEEVEATRPRAPAA